MAIVYSSPTLETYKRASKISCPHCFSIDVRRSTRHGWRDLVRRFHGMFPWRCGVCRKRFYMPRRSQGLVDFNDHVLTTHYKIIKAPMEESFEASE